jgi:3-oxoacyl-[acyl-carrier-protein] synthase-3
VSRAAVVAGLGSFLPRTVVTNQDLAAEIETDDEWIRTRTGIRQRHVIARGESTGDLAVEAARRALRSAGQPTVDALVLATATPDQLSPATAPQVVDRVGLSGIAAFDVSAVCTGFLYGLATAAGLIASGVAERVLVIGADAFSTILAPEDRSTRAVFGDGAGAVVLRAGSPAEPGALRGFHLGSDGALFRLLGRPGGGSREPATGGRLKAEDAYFRMDGKAVFALAVKHMANSIRETADRFDATPKEFDRYVLHQANARILTSVARRLEVPQDRFISNIDRVGNTSAASIPLALDDGMRSGRLQPGQRVVMAAFGGGLTWGSVALTWPKLPTATDTTS